MSGGTAKEQIASATVALPRKIPITTTVKLIDGFLGLQSSDRIA